MAAAPSSSLSVAVSSADEAPRSSLSVAASSADEAPRSSLSVAASSADEAPRASLLAPPAPAPAPPAAASAAAPAADVSLAPSRAPALTLWAIFRLFLGFGMRAWGGPVAQIAALKQALVVEQQWITVPRFNRVLAVYQALPGPEATELCCYFGLLAGGRAGAVVAGLAFLLPGFVSMTAIAALYVRFGQASPAVVGAMRTVQVAVTALVFRAVHKIGGDNVRDHAPGAAPGALSTGLCACAAVAAVEAVMGVNFFLTLVHAATLWAFCFQPGGRAALAWAWALGPLALALAAIIYTGRPLSAFVPEGVGVGALGAGPGPVFLVGLVGGMLTFGGAYTAIPLINYEAVIVGGWLTSQQFLDALAFGQIVPSPLVMFVAFVGYCSAGLAGTLLMTLGMFLPAFSFTIIGHEFFEKVVEAKGAVAHMLDGVSAAVAGFIAVTAVQLLKAAIVAPVDAVVFGAALTILYTSTNRYTAPVLVCAAALVGFILVQPGG